MNFQEEWAAIKAEATAKTQLAGWDEGPGTGRGELSGDSSSYRSTAKHAGTLQNHVRSALTDLQSAHVGLAGKTDGFTSSTTLAKVQTSWEGRLRDVRDECARLQRAYQSAAGSFDANEEGVKKQMSGIGDGTNSATSAPESAR